MYSFISTLIDFLAKVKAKYINNISITCGKYKVFTQLPNEFDIEITPIVNIKLTRRYLATRRNYTSSTNTYPEFTIVLAWLVWHIYFVIKFKPRSN